MGILIKHVTSTKIIPRTRMQSCRAMDITQAIDSGAWTGRKCFLIGGGPSLRGFNWNLLSGYPTITINKAFAAYPKADINYAMDERVYTGLKYSPDKEWVDLRPIWNKFQGIKLFYRAHGTVFQFDPSVYYIPALNRNCLSMDLKAGIYGGTNSGYGALMLAIGLGATSIGLLGYDMKLDASTKATHFHTGYEGQDPEKLQFKLLEFMKCFEDIAPAIKAIGVDVVNLNEYSGLTCFRKMKLEEFISVAEAGSNPENKRRQVL